MADSINDANKVCFMRGVNLFPMDWRLIGAAAARPGAANQAIGAGVSFTTRPGIDAAGLQYGRVTEGQGDLGMSLKSRDFLFAIAATNLQARSGSDEPLKVSAGQAPAGLKLTVARQFGDDAYLAAGYDLRLRKPELSACWTGETATEKAALMLTADPLDRTLLLRAAIATPGPEWRRTVLDEDAQRLERPADDGGRHRLFVTHAMRPHALMAGTVVGCSLDLGRAVNFIADYVDTHLERRLPPLLWKLPGTGLLYRLLVPPEDEAQVRHRMRGWELGALHDFDASKPSLSLTKRFKHGALGGGYDLEGRVASVSADLKGLRLQASASRLEAGWSQPSLQLSVQPLSFL